MIDEMDPDTYPTPEDDYDQYDQDDQDDADEWHPGQCDHCAGPPASHAERAATLASAIIPVCACWVGQGAPEELCQCGPNQTGQETP